MINSRRCPIGNKIHDGQHRHMNLQTPIRPQHHLPHLTHTPPLPLPRRNGRHALLHAPAADLAPLRRDPARRRAVRPDGVLQRHLVATSVEGERGRVDCDIPGFGGGDGVVVRGGWDGVGVIVRVVVVVRKAGDGCLGDGVGEADVEGVEEGAVVDGEAGVAAVFGADGGLEGVCYGAGGEEVEGEHPRVRVWFQGFGGVGCGNAVADGEDLVGRCPGGKAEVEVEGR